MVADIDTAFPFDYDAMASQAGPEPGRIATASRRRVLRWLRPIVTGLAEACRRQADLLRALAKRLEGAEWSVTSLQRQVEYVDGRVDTLSAQMQTTVALGWDYVATVRRLAVLEDRVEALMAAREAKEEAGSSIPFPSEAGPSSAPAAADPQARVG